MLAYVFWHRLRDELGTGAYERSLIDSRGDLMTSSMSKPPAGEPPQRRLTDSVFVVAGLRLALLNGERSGPHRAPPGSILSPHTSLDFLALHI